MYCAKRFRRIRRLFQSITFFENSYEPLHFPVTLFLARQRPCTQPLPLYGLWATLPFSFVSDTAMALFSTELRPVMMGLSAEDIGRLLDLPLFARLHRCEALPSEATNVASLTEAGLIKKDDQGLYLISGIAGAFFARSFSPFPTLARTGIRVVRYPGRDKSGLPTPRFFDGGYARTFTEAALFIRQMTPGFNERYAFEDIRRLLANLIAQRDPQDRAPIAQIEIFDDRLEFVRSGDAADEWHNPKTAQALASYFFGSLEEFQTASLTEKTAGQLTLQTEPGAVRFVLRPAAE